MRTFPVDAVESVLTPMPSVPLAEGFFKELHRVPVVVSHEAQIVDGSCPNALVGAVHRAFSEHRPLVLSPDAIWSTLAAGVAAHIDQNAEQLRSRLVRFQGKKTLQVRVSSAPQTSEDWASAVNEWTRSIAEEVGPGLVALFERPFSTSTDVHRVAARITAMAGFRQYFDYVVDFVCGIPEVTLLGTVEDWKDLRTRIDVLAELDLEDWAHVLRPLADQWLESIEGRPDLDFWQCIHMPREVYGSNEVTGWIGRLFPTLGGLAKAPNPMIPAALAQAHAPGRDRWVLEQGIGLGEFPRGLSLAPVVAKFEAGSVCRYELIAGTIGITQDDEGRIGVEVGWGVFWSPESGPAVEAILARDDLHPESTAMRIKPEVDSAVLGCWTERTANLLRAVGGRLLFGRYHLYRYDEVIPRGFDFTRRGGPWTAVMIEVLDLGDGRALGACARGIYLHEVSPTRSSGGPVALAARPEEIPRVGSSLDEVIGRAVSEGGFEWIDEPSMDAGSAYDALPMSSNYLTADLEGDDPVERPLSVRETNILVDRCRLSYCDRSYRHLRRRFSLEPATLRAFVDSLASAPDGYRTYVEKREGWMAIREKFNDVFTTVRKGEVV